MSCIPDMASSDCSASYRQFHENRLGVFERGESLLHNGVLCLGSVTCQKSR